MHQKNGSKVRNTLILDHYERNEFKEWAFDAVDKGFSPLELEYLPLFENKNAHILDIGCGGGRETLALVKNGFAKITGMDFSFKSCEVYKERFRKKKNIRVLNANGAFLPFADGSFDYLFCLGNMICFLDSKELRAGLVSEIKRCLRPGGKALMTALGFEGRAINSPLYLFLSIMRIFQKTPPVGTSLPWLKKNGRMNLRFWRTDEPQSYWFKKGEFEKVLAESGLTIIPASSGKVSNVKNGICCSVVKS